MKMIALIAPMLVALTGCGTPDPDDTPASRSDTRQIPSNYTPGLHVSGYANIGVKKRL